MINEIKKELENLNEEYNMLTSSLKISVSKHLFDDRFTIVWANDYYYELTGYTKKEYEEIFNNNCRDYFRDDLDEYEKTKKVIVDAFDKGEKSYNRICRMPCKNGKHLWINFIGTFTNEVINGFPVIYVIYTDINELVETQNKLKEEHEKLDKTLLLEEKAIDFIKTLYKFQDLEKKFPDILGKLITTLDAERAYVLKNENDSFVVTHGCTKSKELVRMVSGTSLIIEFLPEWRREFQKGNSVIVNNIDELENTAPEFFEILKEYDVKRLVIAPIIMNNEVDRYLIIDNPSELTFKRFSIIETICYFISAALENENLNNILVYNSYYDTLTGLFNRNKYLDDVKKFSFQNRRIGILFMDINGLKTINDLYGHQHGDEILKEAGNILRTTFCDYNVYRIGGDEYVVLALDIEEKIFNKKIKETRQRLFLSKECKGAVGYKWLDNSENLEREIIIADKSMYRDKMEYYRHNQAMRRYRYENDNMLALCNPNVLKEEIDNGRFEVFLQPKVDFKRLVIGAEALIRYRDKEEKIVMPNNFITLFENSRVINILDYHVFERTCQIIKNWIEKKYDVKPISVNFSRYTLKNINFLEKLNEIWNKYKIPKYLLEIEIIENDEEIGNDMLNQILQKIKAAGYSLSLDDFGTRYSNIALFIDTDLDTLKIDRSLMKNITENKRAQLLIKSFVQICNNLGIRLIVEGVETEEQFALLNELKCDGIQGYLISRPIPLEEYEVKFLTKI